MCCYRRPERKRGFDKSTRPCPKSCDWRALAGNRAKSKGSRYFGTVRGFPLPKRSSVQAPSRVRSRRATPSQPRHPPGSLLKLLGEEKHPPWPPAPCLTWQQCTLHVTGRIPKASIFRHRERGRRRRRSMIRPRPSAQSHRNVDRRFRKAAHLSRLHQSPLSPKSSPLAWSTTIEFCVCLPCDGMMATRSEYALRGMDNCMGFLPR